MKKVTIYATAIKVSEGMTLDDLTVVDGFEELLDSNISADRFKELTDAFREKGIEIISIVAPDGFTDELLIDKEILKVILDANKNGGGAYGKYFDAPKPEIVGVSNEDFDKLSPLFKVARQLGISFQFNPRTEELKIGTKYGIEWYRKDTPDRKHRGNPVLTLDQATAWRDEMNKKHPDLHHSIYEEHPADSLNESNKPTSPKMG